MPSLAEIVSRELTGAYKTLVEGENMRIINKKGKVKPVFLQMTPTCHMLKVAGASYCLCLRIAEVPCAHRQVGKTVVDVAQIQEVRIGFLTQTMLSFAADHCTPDQGSISTGVTRGQLTDAITAFSLIYLAGNDANTHSVDLICDTPERRQVWAHVLTLVQRTCRRALSCDGRDTVCDSPLAVRIVAMERFAVLREGVAVALQSAHCRRCCFQVYCLITPFLAHLRDGKSTMSVKVCRPHCAVIASSHSHARA